MAAARLRVPWGPETRSMAAARALPRDVAVRRHRSISVTRQCASITIAMAIARP